MFKAILANSSDDDDDEELNRLKAEKAKEEWKKKSDLSKGKDINPSKPRKEMDDFIEDEIPKKKFKDEPVRKKSLDDDEKIKKSGNTLGFAAQGTVKAHDNEGGPECFKCGQVCKDNSNLKNHVLSHYYQVFYDVLPDSKPYPCPICGNTSRDRITLVRHYAFSHKMFFEMTDVTPEHIAGSKIGSQGARVQKKKKKTEDSDLVIRGGEAGAIDRAVARVKKPSNYDKIKSSLDKLKDSDSEEEDVEDKIKKMNSKFLKVNDGSSAANGDDERSKEHKKHKKHKEHKHKKDKKHKKEKKHKKDKHHDREKEKESSSGNPLSSLIKDMSPISSDSERSQSKPPNHEDRNGGFHHRPRTPPGSPPSRTNSPDRDVHENREGGDDDNAEDESDDELGDLPAPVFA